MSEPVRPVALETPLKQQQFVDPKTGALTIYGHHVVTALFERTGGFDDDVWRALGLGFTNLSQQASSVRRLEDLETSALGLRAQVNSIRGDPRLATAERAENIAEDALFIALARAPAEVVRRVEELERAVAFLNTATNQNRSMVQQQQRAANEAANDAGVRNAFDTQRWAALARITDEAIQAIQDELDTAAADFDDSVHAAVSASAPLTYDAVNGIFGANASLTSLGGLSVIADRFVYGTGSNTWALGTITTFGRNLLDDADATAGRSTLGLGSLATASSINDGNWSGADLTIANGGTGSSTAAAARTALGLEIGTNVQAYNVNLASLAGLTLAADTVLYASGAGTVATTTFTPGAWVAWVPTVSASTPAGSGFTYTITQARYAKTGRSVTIQSQILITSLGSGPAASGNITMTLPFTAGAAAVAFGYESGVSGLGVTGRIDSGASLATFRLTSGAATAVLNARLWVATTYEAST